MNRKELYNRCSTLSHCCMKVRLRCASERLVSLITHKPLDAIAVGYRTPLSPKMHFTLVNALGIRVAHMEEVDLEQLLTCPFLEWIEVFSVDTPMIQKFHRQVEGALKAEPKSWMKVLKERSWEKSVYKTLEKSLKGRKPLFSSRFRIKDNSIPLQKDEAFLAKFWPYLYQMLLQDEFHLALPLASTQDPSYQVFLGLEKGVVDMKALTDIFPGIPEIEGNRCVVFQHQPSKDINSIHERFGKTIEDVHERMKRSEPAYLPWDEILETYNELAVALGKPLLSHPERPEGAPDGLDMHVLLTRSPPRIRVRMENGDVIAISPHAESFPDLTLAEKREILLHLDARANPEHPLEALRTHLTQSIAEHRDESI